MLSILVSSHRYVSRSFSVNAPAKFDGKVNFLLWTNDVCHCCANRFDFLCSQWNGYYHVHGEPMSFILFIQKRELSSRGSSFSPVKRPSYFTRGASAKLPSSYRRDQIWCIHCESNKGAREHEYVRSRRILLRGFGSKSRKFRVHKNLRDSRNSLVSRDVWNCQILRIRSERHNRIIFYSIYYFIFTWSYEQI